MITISGYSWVGRSMTPRPRLSTSLTITMAELDIQGNRESLLSLEDEERCNKRKIIKREAQREEEILKLYWMDMKKYFDEVIKLN